MKQFLNGLRATLLVVAIIGCFAVACWTQAKYAAPPTCSTGQC